MGLSVARQVRFIERVLVSSCIGGPGGQLVEADGNGLAQVHGGLAVVGGDFNKELAPGEIFAGETVFFRAEDEGNLAAARELRCNQGRERGKRDDRLLGFAMGEGSGADDECAFGHGFGQALRAAGDLEEFFGPDSRFRLTPMRLIRRDDGEMRKAEVGHGARGRSDIEGIAWRDQHHADGMGFRGQETIVVPRRPWRRAEAGSCYTAFTYGPRYGFSFGCGGTVVRDGALVLHAGLGSGHQRQLQRARP